MADTKVISWGKPLIEFKKIGEEEWTPFSTPVENSTQLTVNKGEKKEAKEEGGGVVATMYKKNNYSLVLKLFAKSGEDKPFEDEDGVVVDIFSIRLSSTLYTDAPGFIMDKAAASVAESYTSEEGIYWEYTFDALVPDDNTAMLKPYELA